MSRGSRDRRRVSVTVNCTVCNPTERWASSCTVTSLPLLGRNFFLLDATSKTSKWWCEDSARTVAPCRGPSSARECEGNEKVTAQSVGAHRSVRLAPGRHRRAKLIHLPQLSIRSVNNRVRCAGGKVHWTLRPWAVAMKDPVPRTARAQLVDCA